MPTTPQDAPTLTPRQIQIAALLVAGATNDQISRRLDMSFTGAQSAVRRLLAATGTTSRTQAAIWALEHGLVPTPAGRVLVDAQALTILLEALRPSSDAARRPSVHLLAAEFVHRHPCLTETGHRRGATLPPATHTPPRHEVAP